MHDDIGKYLRAPSIGPDFSRIDTIILYGYALFFFFFLEEKMVY